MVQYTSISSPGTFRLATVVEVEIDEVEGLVHTCIVEYSLLAELREQERDKYKGVTKKRLRCPVQRFVIILPVEEAEVSDCKDVESRDVREDLEVEKIADEKEDHSSKFSVTNVNSDAKEGSAWDDRGPGLVENGETKLFPVRRRDCRVFELVNLDWYRSDVVSNSDPGSSSTDLWNFFKCFKDVSKE